MLKYRLIFGILFGALFIGLVAVDSWASGNWPERAWSAPPGAFVALGCLVVIPLALREMRALLKKENVIISMRITVVASILCMLWPWVEQVAESLAEKHDRPGEILMSEPDAATQAARQDEIRAIERSPWYAISKWTRTVKPHYLVPTIMALSLVGAMAMHSRHQKVEGAMANAGGTLLAITYLGVLPGFFLPICMTRGAWIMLVIVAVVKAADIGAYTTGHLIGRHKLIPWLSPGKTVEGFFGGLIFSAAVAVGASYVLFRMGAAADFKWQAGIFAGVLLGAMGQFGDLFESLLKRDAGVKDSGTVPGFGGILDILDSPLLAAPMAYWLLKLL